MVGEPVKFPPLRRLPTLAAILALFVSAIGVVPDPADACVIGYPFNERTIDDAEVIFRGRPIAYARMEDEFVTARLGFQVMETYRGEHRRTWHVVWQNSTYSIPDNLWEFVERYGWDVVVGLVPPGWRGRVDDPRSYVVIPPSSGRLWELPWVLQVPCSPPFMGAYWEIEPLLRRRGVVD